jgi:hypothetical protein
MITFFGNETAAKARSLCPLRLRGVSILRARKSESVCKNLYKNDGGFVRHRDKVPRWHLYTVDRADTA